MEPKFQIQLKIRKPAAEVFDAVVNPEKLTGYFLQTTSGPLVEGVTVKWKFAEVEQPFDVVVTKVVANERIEFDWPSGKAEAPTTHVEMVFKPMDAANTMVQVSESGWPATETGFQGSHGNAAGWMHMLACLKAYIEYGINLRAGGVF